MKLCPAALILSVFALCNLALCPRADAATDLLRYNLTLDATACGNTEDVTGADSYYIAGTFTAILPDGSARNYSAVTYPFAINDNQWMGYQTVLFDDMLPRGTRIYGQMRFYDEDFAKDWNAVAAKFNTAADAGVKAAAASGNPTAAGVAGAAYAAFKVFDAVSSGDKDDLLGQVGVSIGDSALAPGGVAKIVIKDGAMNYDYNHPARAIIKAQADGAFANKSFVNYYSGDIRFSKSDITGWSSWAYTQSWFAFIQDPNLDPKTGQPIAQPNNTPSPEALAAQERDRERRRVLARAAAKAAPVTTTDKGKQPFTYQGDFTKKTTGLKPALVKENGVGGTGGGLVGKIPGGLGGKIPGGLAGKIPGGLLGGGIKPGGDGAGMGGVTAGNGIGGAQNLPGGLPLPGAGDTPQTETPGNMIPGTETPETPGTETGGVAGPAPGAVSTTPMVGQVGQTMAVTLDSKEAQDFNLDLPAGQFFVYADVQRLGEKSTLTNIDATLFLLKRNGAQMPNYEGSLIYFNSGDSTTRVGKPFSFVKPTGVRFRFKNESNGAHNLWLTVVPANPVKFLPFGFGQTLKTIAIGPNNGSGGQLEERGFAYLRATIPAGKWSVSLGAKSEDNCSVDLNSYNERGVAYPTSISIYGVDKDARKEEIITLIKPTTLIFRVLNDSQAPAVTYDVTIEPATD